MNVLYVTVTSEVDVREYVNIEHIAYRLGWTIEQVRRKSCRGHRRKELKWYVLVGHQGGFAKVWQAQEWVNAVAPELEVTL